jgi:hypothetical protein
MTWLAIRAFLGGALSKLWALLSHLSLWQGICLALAAFALVQHFQLADARHDRDAWHKQFTSEHSARLADQTAYRNAQAAATAQNKAHVANVEAQQQRISDNVETRYRADLARLRAQRGIVQQANPAPQRPTGGTASPAPGTATSGPDPKAVPLPPAELLRAQETELQLNALIDWVLGQSAVDPNKP